MYPPDQAILICVSLMPAVIGQWKALYNGKSVGVTRAIPFATTFIDLNCPMEMWAKGPFDYLHFYLSRELLKRIAHDNAVRSSFQLQEVFFVEDLVVAQMTRSILSPVKHGEPLDTLALDQIATILPAAPHLADALRHPQIRSRPQMWSGALAKTPSRRNEETRTLKGNLTIKELATACSLSLQPISDDAFGRTFGTSVHQQLNPAPYRTRQAIAFAI